jgi:hypothetical protein
MRQSDIINPLPCMIKKDIYHRLSGNRIKKSPKLLLNNRGLYYENGKKAFSRKRFRLKMPFLPFSDRKSGPGQLCL